MYTNRFYFDLWLQIYLLVRPTNIIYSLLRASGILRFELQIEWIPLFADLQLESMCGTEAEPKRLARSQSKCIEFERIPKVSLRGYLIEELPAWYHEAEVVRGIM